MSDPKAWYKRPWLVVGAVVGALIAALVLFFVAETVYFMYMFKTGKMKPADRYVSQALRQSIAEAMKNTPVTVDQMKRLESGDNPTLGNPEAKLRIVQFVDFDCPYTKQMAEIVKGYVERNAETSYLVIRDYPMAELHPNAEISAIAARCIRSMDPSLYWPYHDWLFANQGSHSVDALLAGAAGLGIDSFKFSACLEKRTGWTQIQQGIIDGQAFGVTGTPTYYFNGRLIQGAMSEDFFQALADETRAQTEAKPD